MLNLLQILRYCVFGEFVQVVASSQLPLLIISVRRVFSLPIFTVVFLICNAVITSVAVWNLSIIETIPSLSNAKQTDALLIFVGASGLLLILTIFFFDLHGGNVPLVRVWFELAWVALYCILELAGAAALTAQSTSQTCDPNPMFFASSSPCASTQVLQAFTWICATLLLGYLTFLSILTIVKRRDDPTIWHCTVRRFPVATNQTIKDVPPSPGYPRFREELPIIAAPIPRRLPTHREPILSYNSGLSYRSGLGLDYEIEHYQSPESVIYSPTSEEQAISRPIFTFPATIAPVAARASRIAAEQEQRIQQPAYSSPFYHTSVQSAFESQRNQPQAPAPAHVEQIRRLPPSPPPLGDWPRLDATSKPSRVKRKPLPLPQPESEPHDPQSHQRLQLQPDSPERRPSQSRPQPLPQPPPQPQPRPQSQPQMHRQKRPLPPTKQTASASYTFDAPALTAALQPLEASQSMRSKPSRPSGPRRKSTSIDDGRPADLDMSNYRSKAFS
ncbi:hypothetical protein CVT25_003973 [Psilocybe cyanescens]|uniref:MARVEL domain-containing protein n=1 Tax=Psilocybe cyanescens TaxID=93625 RepID=A0A409WXT0_PSICY|nr:hypothetical protein CVT25_003973 [Psilocybe cyanescens]